MIYLIAVHGLHGNLSDFQDFLIEFKQKYDETRNEDLLLLNSKYNTMFKTHDGLETMGKRLSEEIIHHYRMFMNESNKELDKELKWIFIGHSLGGLICRMALTYLFQCEINQEEEHSKDYCFKCQFKNISNQFLSFITVGTPHLGVQRYLESQKKEKEIVVKDEENNKEIVLEYGKYTKSKIWILDTLLPTLSHHVLPFFKTGQDLLHHSSSLVQLSSPASISYKILEQFKQITVVGHLRDCTVPVSSSMIWQECLSDGCIRYHGKVETLEEREGKRLCLLWTNYEGKFMKEYLRFLEIQPFSDDEPVVLSEKELKSENEEDLSDQDLVYGSELIFPKQLLSFNDLKPRKILMDYVSIQYQQQKEDEQSDAPKFTVEPYPLMPKMLMIHPVVIGKQISPIVLGKDFEILRRESIQFLVDLVMDDLESAETMSKQ